MFYYYNLNVRPYLLDKFFWSQTNLLPEINRIELYSFNKKIKSNLDSDVFKSIAFLETLCQQTCGNFFFSFIDKRRKILSGRSLITLRSTFLFSFLNYLCCFLLVFIKKLSDRQSLLLPTTYRFCITDFSVFPFLPLSFYYWKKKFIVEFFFSNISSVSVKMFLSCFNFSLLV